MVVRYLGHLFQRESLFRLKTILHSLQSTYIPVRFLLLGFGRVERKGSFPSQVGSKSDDSRKTVLSPGHVLELSGKL